MCAHIWLAIFGFAANILLALHLHFILTRLKVTNLQFTLLISSVFSFFSMFAIFYNYVNLFIMLNLYEHVTDDIASPAIVASGQSKL